MTQELQESLFCPQYKYSILHTLYVNVTKKGGFTLALVSSGFELDSVIRCPNALPNCGIDSVDIQLPSISQLLLESCMSAVHSTDTREGGNMQEIVAYCGLVCNECPAYEATQRNDNDARARVAEEWSKQFQHNFKAEDINCSGCLTVGEVQFGYCSMCDIRKCGSDREVLNCAYCVEYPCDKLNDFHTKVAEAKAKLEAMRNNK